MKVHHTFWPIRCQHSTELMAYYDEQCIKKILFCRFFSLMLYSCTRSKCLMHASRCSGSAVAFWFLVVLDVTVLSWWSDPMWASEIGVMSQEWITHTHSVSLTFILSCPRRNISTPSSRLTVERYQGRFCLPERHGGGVMCISDGMFPSFHFLLLVWVSPHSLAAEKQSKSKPQQNLLLGLDHLA